MDKDKLGIDFFLTLVFVYYRICEQNYTDKFHDLRE